MSGRQTHAHANTSLDVYGLHVYSLVYHGNQFVSSVFSFHLLNGEYLCLLALHRPHIRQVAILGPAELGIVIAVFDACGIEESCQCFPQFERHVRLALW